MSWIGTGVLVLLLSVSAQCAAMLVRPPLVRSLNEGFAEQVFVTRRDIKANFAADGEVLFKRGQKVRIWLEGRPDWIKLRAWPASISREQARGATIMYIFADDLPPVAGIAGESTGRALEFLALRRLIVGIHDNLEPVDKKTSPKRR